MRLLPDEMHRLPGFLFGARDGTCGDVLEKPGQVAREGAHGLHSFQVLRGLALFTPVGDVPVLRPDDVAAEHLEREVEALEGRRGASAPADGDRRDGLAIDRVGV